MPHETKTIQLTLQGHQINVSVPSDPEKMLLEAVDGEAAGDLQADPYWGLLWDAAPKTAEQILRNEWPQGLTAVELGCGVGLAGIAGLIAGLDVTMTDLVPTAVEMAVNNAAMNGFPSAKGKAIDWRNPPEHRFDFIVASDVLYDTNNHQPLLNTLNQMLNKDGVVWIGDAGRANAPKFIELARKADWDINIQDEHGRPLSKPTHVQFQLIVMRQTGHAG